jgi:superfamily II DNA/RNA helicase
MAHTNIVTAAAAAAPSTNASTMTWDECVGPAKWLLQPLQRILSYPHPLPVQLAVIPTITRALMSGVPNDVSLTAPTGSGKTLCYLVPLLRLLTEAKKGVDDNALRCLILVPTTSLGQQVYRELQRLTRPSSIRVACLCAEEAYGVHSAEVDAAEADSLVRRVELPQRAELHAFTGDTAKDNFASRSSGVAPADATDGDVDDNDEDGEADSCISSDSADNTASHGSSEDESGVSGERNGVGTPHSVLPSRDRGNTGMRVRYFSNADVVVATPQHLLHHLDHTRGLRLGDLRLLVIDEADQVLAGNFASQVQKVNARYEYEVRKQQREQQRQQRRLSAELAARMAAPGQASLSSCSFSILPWHGDHRGGGGVTSVHKVLCSATLSSRIARISQVKLRNCSYYILDSNGVERKEEAATVTAAAEPAKHGSPAAGAALTVRTQFALPPTLQEHIIFVEDAYRPAVLLKLVHTLRERIAAVRRHARMKAAQRTAADEGDGNAELKEGEETTQTSTAVSSSMSAAATTYPSVEDKAGTGILIFCASAEEARVMSHFLAAAGVTSVVEFTTLASEAERRRALLQKSADADGADVSCVVASDALMRGIDVPNVGHVIMYHPPDAVSQYVHRAGRTARAMRPGHVHLLLSKTGPSGTQEDGEMALYKRLSQSLSRTLPVSYERLFFRFAENPSRHSAAAVPAAEAGATTTTAAPSSPSTAGSAEWWVEQAEQFLIQSQHQLQRRWASVLESAAAVAVANAKKTNAVEAAATSRGTAGGTAKSVSASASPRQTKLSRKRTRADAP